MACGLFITGVCKGGPGEGYMGDLTGGDYEAIHIY